MQHVLHYGCNMMTREAVLAKYKHDQQQENIKKVLDAISSLEDSTPTKIFQFINKQGFSISIRTVKFILKDLTNLNYIIRKEHGIYSIDKSKNRALLFPNSFGELMLYSIGNFFPTNIEKSLEEYVNRYGLLIIFTFFQLLEFKNSYEKDDLKVSHFNDKEISNWLESAVPLKSMFNWFEQLYFDPSIQDTKNINLQKLKGLHKIIEKKYPSLYKEFNDNIKKNEELNGMIVTGRVIPGNKKDRENWYDQLSKLARDQIK